LAWLCPDLLLHILRLALSCLHFADSFECLISDCFLHLSLQFPQPVFHVTCSLDGCRQLHDLYHAFFEALETHYQETVELVKVDLLDSIEQTLQVTLNRVWLRSTLTEDVQQRIVRDELEPGELLLFAFELGVQLLLALDQTSLEVGQLCHDNVVLSSVLNEFDFVRNAHDPGPALVDLLELFGLGGHGLGDITRHVHHFQSTPHLLHFQDLGDGTVQLVEQLHQVHHALDEWLHVFLVLDGCDSVLIVH